MVVLTAVLLGISPLSADFYLERTDRHTSNATISRIEVAQNEWATTGSQRFVGTLMLPDAKGSLLTADGHFLRRPSKLATNRRGAIAACRVRKSMSGTGNEPSLAFPSEYLVSYMTPSSTGFPQ